MKDLLIERPELYSNCETLLYVCANIQPDETALIISDWNTEIIGNLIQKFGKAKGVHTVHQVITPFSYHGQEPPEHVGKEMLEHAAVFCLTEKSMAHSQACVSASRSGVKFLSLPDFSLDLLSGAALQADFKGLTATAQKLADILTNGSQLNIKTEIGTCLECSLEGRSGNAAPGWCWGQGVIASPPDAEVNIAPVEDSCNGTMVVDGSVTDPDIGLLNEPIVIKIEGGRIVKIEGEKAAALYHILKSQNDSRSFIVAEIGIGLNPYATLKGIMLEDEGCRGTVHVGVGANRVLGGQNDVAFHIDHMIRKPTICVDSHMIVNLGEIQE